MGKPADAPCVLLLLDCRLIGFDDPVARHWPEFTAPDVTVRHLLSHTSGLPAFPVARPAGALGGRCARRA